MQMVTESGVEFLLGKSDENNVIIQVGEEFAEILTLELTDEESNNISINYNASAGFDEDLITEIVAKILNDEAVTQQLKMENFTSNE